VLNNSWRENKTLRRRRNDLLCSEVTEQIHKLTMGSHVALLITPFTCPIVTWENLWRPLLTSDGIQGNLRIGTLRVPYLYL